MPKHQQSRYHQWVNGKCSTCKKWRLGTPQRTEANFWSKVNKSAGQTACWLWTGAVTTHGYGEVQWYGKVKRAHQVSWELAHGPVNFSRFNTSRSLGVLHKCDTPLCVNPAHLFIGTLKDNSQDMVRKGRKPSKLTPALVRLAISCKAKGEEINSIAERFGVSRNTVSRAVNGHTWTAIHDRLLG